MPLDSTTAITIDGVECWDESAEERFGRSGSSAERVLVCRWANRLALISHLLPGGPVVLVGGQILNAPASYPDAPHLLAHDVQVRGEGVRSVGSNGAVAYEWARLTVRYKTLEFGFDPEASGSEALDFASEVQMYPADEVSLAWTSDAADVSPTVMAPLLLTQVSFVKSRRNVPSIPITTILHAAENPVNSAPFMGAAAGKVKFDGAQTFRRLTVDGDESWDLTLRFIYKPQGWNALFRAATGIYEAVTVKPTGQPPLPTSDLNLLLLD